MDGDGIHFIHHTGVQLAWKITHSANFQDSRGGDNEIVTQTENI